MVYGAAPGQSSKNQAAQAGPYLLVTFKGYQNECLTALHGAFEAQNGKKMFDGTSAILAAELPSLGKQECPSF